MAERLHPGVYVEEVSSGIRPIEAVGTSTAAFVGEAARGRPGYAHFLTSFDDYQKALGDHLPDDKGLLAQAVQTFFLAGGRRAYAVRVLPSDAKRGASIAVGTRLASAAPTEGWPNALSFQALGDGAWADALRIDIGGSTHFPDEAFRVDVKWVEGGASRTLETFDDVRMDPKSEDYFADVIKRTSAYVTAQDLYQADVTSATPAAAPIPERSAAVKPATAAKYRVYSGVDLTFQWADSLGGGDKISKTVQFNDAKLTAAIGKTFTDGAIDLTPKELGLMLQSQLGTDFRVVPDPSLAATPSTDVPEIQAGAATRPYLFIHPIGAATTFDFNGGRTLTLTIAGADHVIDPTTNNPAPADVTKVKPGELVTTINATLPAGITAFTRGNAVVVRGAPTAISSAGKIVESTPGIVAWTASGGAGGTIVEHLDGVTLSVSESRPPSVKSVLASLGLPAKARGYDEGSAANPALRPAATTNLRVAGGTDGSKSAVLGVTDYAGSGGTGLSALDHVDVNLVAIPGKNSPAFIAAGMTYCDNRGDCFFIADGPGSTAHDFQMDASEAKLFVDGLPQRSKNSAVYFPWVEVPDPIGVGRNPTRFVPPSGYIAGVYARTDVARGVWKAPAGIEASLGGSLDLQVKIRDADQDLLNPVGLNCVRQLPGAGIVTWGARTLASDAEWRYVPVRRMALFLKESLRRGLLWAVFEPNDVPLWDQIRSNISSFMLGLFRQGAFQGGKPEDAFLVRCDRTTNPQERVDAGIVTAQVAFAPLKPAEFVVIEISQKSLVS